MASLTTECNFQSEYSCCCLCTVFIETALQLKYKSGTKNLVLIWPGTGIPHVLRAPHKAMYMHACESEYNCVVTLLYSCSY